jgi:tripartite-type tricarboxylate transporter receptor subunit TctC
MDLTRHKILRLGAGVVLLSAVSRGVSALDYPTRPVRMLVGFAAGSAFDILARLIAQWLSERLGQPFVVENRSGAAGSVAPNWAPRSPRRAGVVLQRSMRWSEARLRG